MAKRPLEQVQETVDTLLKKIEGRRVSVLPSCALDEVQDAKDSSQIKSKAQLEYWVKKDATAVLIYIAESRYERDAALKCVESWETLVVDKEKAYDTALKAQDRHNNGKKELTSIKAQMIPLQETVDNLKEDLRLRDEKINRLQDSLAIAQADTAQARQETLASPTPSIITGRRFVKFPDPPIFIGDNNPSFED